MKKIFEYDLQSASYSDAFDALLRGHHLATDQARAIALGEAQNNTYRLPSDAETRFTAARNQRSVLRPLCTTLSVAQGDNRILVSQRDSEAKWLQPGEQYPTVEDAFTQMQSRPKKLGSVSVISADVVHDGLFDVVGHLVDTFGRRFAQVEDACILCGSGEAGELAGLTQQAQQMSITELSFTTLLDVYLSIEPEYRDAATWVISDITYALLRALTDGSGRPLMDITSNGAQLLGRPVVISMGCPDSNIMFGDFSHLWVLDRSPLMVTPLVEMYAAQDQIAYHGWCLVDAVLTRPEAVVCASIGAEATTTSEDEDEATESSELAVVDAE